MTFLTILTSFAAALALSPAVIKLFTQFTNRPLLDEDDLSLVTPGQNLIQCADRGGTSGS